MKAAMDELAGLSVEQIFSSPPPPPEPPRPPRPVRTEASSARSEPTLPHVTAPRTVAVEVQHRWSKEVEQKLRQVFKLPRFRTHQKEAIDETMAGRDGGSAACLLIM